jgi:poly(beta-D-mannuronate) lyase
LRFFSQDHRIHSNYFENCRPAITIGNGGATIPPGPLTSHERPDGVHVVFNTLVNNRRNVQMSRRRNGLGANDLVFANNIVVGGNEAVSIDGPLGNPTWEGNIIWANDGGAGDLPVSGFTVVDPGLSPSEEGHHKISESSPAIGAGVGSYPYVELDVEAQPRGKAKDVGADQLTREPRSNSILTVEDVGPQAPVKHRPWISAPILNVEWIRN